MSGAAEVLVVAAGSVALYLLLGLAIKWLLDHDKPLPAASLPRHRKPRP